MSRLLLGTAAGLVMVAGAHAADMPVEARPVQHVKVCSPYGDGFYYVPGTNTCLKIGGFLRVQAEYNAGAAGAAVGNGTTEAAQARFARDVTNNVNYRVRSVISLDAPRSQLHDEARARPFIALPSEADPRRPRASTCRWG